MRPIFWPWHKLPEPDLEESKRAVVEAKEWQARTRRVAKATERAIVQNHFAHDIRKAMEGQ